MIVQALNEHAALVLVSGEAGIGKTRLVQEALLSLSDQSTMLAACPPLREPFPLGPIVDGMRRVRQRVGPVELSPLGGALRPLFPEWADDLPAALEPLDEPREVRHRLFRALTELVGRLGVDVLVLEDAHWADATTLEWLLTLCASGDLAMSIVVTYRPYDVPDGSLLRRLTSRPPVELRRLLVELEPLDLAQTRQMIGSMFATEQVSEQFAEFLHERTDGLPLAVEETIRLLRDRDDIVQQDGHWSRRTIDELVVPPMVRDSVLERVERLSPTARRMLDAAAVVADPADEALLIEVAGINHEDGHRGIAAALGSGLLRETERDRYAFRHALDAQVEYDTIPVSERRRLHGCAANALRKRNPLPVVRLSRHCWEAGDLEAWCEYGEASADLALESGDDHTAVTLLLDLLGRADHPADRRSRLARKLGESAAFGTATLGELAGRAIEALRAVLGEDGMPRSVRGEVRLLVGRLLWQIGERHQAFVEIETAVSDLTDRPDLAVRAMTTLAAPMATDWPVARHLDWLERAARLLPQVHSPAARTAYKVNRAASLLMLGESAGWQAVAEIQDSATSLAEQQMIAGSRLNVAELATSWGRYGEARTQLDAAVDRLETIGYQRFASNARITGAYIDWFTGAWESLRNTATEVIASADSRPADRLEADLLFGLLELVRGARTLADQRIRGVSEHYARLGVVDLHVALAAAALGRLHLADGAVEQALRVTTPLIEIIARKGVWLWATDIVSVHLDAATSAGCPEHVEQLLAQFAEGIEGRDAPAPTAGLAMCRAVIAESKNEPAAALYASAAAAWAELPRPYDELLALERQGRSLLDTREHDTGLAVLSGAQQRLRSLGASWDADRIAHSLRINGIDVVRTWRRGRKGYGDELSPRELEVVDLAARGMTNRQIAEALFLSYRTVERHIRRAMRKLNVSSRTALAMAAADAGLISPRAGRPAQ